MAVMRTSVSPSLSTSPKAAPSRGSRWLSESEIGGDLLKNALVRWLRKSGCLGWRFGVGTGLSTLSEQFNGSGDCDEIGENISVEVDQSGAERGSRKAGETKATAHREIGEEGHLLD